jgi:catechol 2,3-dioxygenase-like lactoylglutathione lyase family enzyme
MHILRTSELETCISPKKMQRVATLTRHLTHGYSAESVEARVREGPALGYDKIVNLSLEQLQTRYGASPPEAVKFHGVNHVAFVCSDMAKTLWFWCEILGFRLVKTLELPGNGQHFFLDGGNNCAVAYFYFPDAPKAAPGVSSVDMKGMLTGKGFATAMGSVNHVAFNVPLEKLREYRERVKSAKLGFVTPILFHSDKDPSGYSPQRDENTCWESFYFSGPDGEYLEMTAQTDRAFTPQRDILHKPAVGRLGH